MEFEFDEDQRLLQQMVRETVAKSRSLPAEQLWTTYLDLSWLEAPPVELAIVLEELGYVADPTPFLATATWFAPLAGLLPAGAGTGVFDGTGRFVLDADRADEVALVTRGGVVVVSGSEVSAEPVATFDPTLHVAHVNAPDLMPGIPDLALMGLAISTVGSCRRILDLTVAHVKQRIQFGVPIGSFQAVKLLRQRGVAPAVLRRVAGQEPARVEQHPLPLGGPLRHVRAGPRAGHGFRLAGQVRVEEGGELGAELPDLAFSGQPHESRAFLCTDAVPSSRSPAFARFK